MSYPGKGTRLLLPFGLDYSDVLSISKAKENSLTLPINGDLNPTEHSIARQLITITRLISDGPFYTGYRTEKNDLLGTNDGIVRHSDKYKRPRKAGPTIEEHPYQLEYFPEELYSVMGISGSQRKKLLSLSQYNKNGQLTNFGSEDQEQSILDKLKNMAEEEEDPATKEDREEEEDFDDEFEDDDDDDYNAEKYFDDGDDDGVDGDDDEAAF